MPELVTPNRAAEAVQAAKAGQPAAPVRDPVGTVLDALFSDAVGDALRDIRQKVVEEGWFGRAVTEAPAQVDIWSTLGKGEAAPAEGFRPAHATVPRLAIPTRDEPAPDLEPEL